MPALLRRHEGAASSPNAAQPTGVYRMINTHRPLEEKMTLFWHDLFATAWSKVAITRTMVQPDRHVPRARPGRLPHAAGQAVERSGDDLLAGQPDEHQGRPQRELRPRAARAVLDGHRQLHRGRRQGLRPRVHRLGAEATRSPSAIRTAASTGSSSSGPDAHDYGEKTFLGERGTFDGEDIIDIIVRQPATARFVAAQLYDFFVSDAPDEAAIAELAEVFMRSQYDIRAMMRHLFLSDWFRSEEALYAKVKSPRRVRVGVVGSSATSRTRRWGIGELGAGVHGTSARI